MACTAKKQAVAANNSVSSFAESGRFANRDSDKPRCLRPPRPLLSAAVFRRVPVSRPQTSTRNSLRPLSRRAATGYKLATNRAAMASQFRCQRIKKPPQVFAGALFTSAEGKGFEPSTGCPASDFESDDANSQPSASKQLNSSSQSLGTITGTTDADRAQNIDLQLARIVNAWPSLTEQSKLAILRIIEGGGE